MSRSSDLLAALSRAYNLTETHDLDDPQVRDALLDVRDAAAGGSLVEVEVFPDGLGVRGADPAKGRVPGVLAQDLASLGVSGMTIPADVRAPHLERFLGLLRDAVEGSGISLELGGAAARPGTGHPALSLLSPTADEQRQPGYVAPEEQQAEETVPGEMEAGDVVFEAPEAEEPAEAAGRATGEEPAEATSRAAGEEPAGGAVVEGEAVPEEAPDPAAERIEELLEVYREASPAEEDAAADAIRDEAEGFRREGTLDALARLVEELILAAENDEVPEEAVDLAREFAGHGVMARIAIHLGAARAEERRHELTDVACRLGGDMASAIADALTDAPDRSARRIYMEAMEAMGPDALKIAQSMAADSRWFIARNGVALLGELADQDAIQHLTTPLAHSDPRLRKETVLTLAKLGGEDAGNLCVGMLGDADPDVRASAAMAVGVLKVDKARRQLLDRLESEPDPDVQVEVLKALGQLGDPGSVPAIEKRAVGGIFSRSPTDVRIAAYRALAAIGTPHALGLLEQAAEDKDLEVRTATRSLLQRREKAGVAAQAQAEAEAEAEVERELKELDAEAEDQLELE